MESRQFLSVTAFAAPVSYTVGTAPSAQAGNVSSDGVATGDFNGDGKPDLAVAHTADGTVNILLNYGNGTFKPAISYKAGTPNPIWVTVADVNGDGKLDLLTLGTSTGAGSVGVLLGNGNGTFKTAVSYSVGQGIRGGVAVGDFNGDGKPDLALTQFAFINNNTQSPVDILINNGNGTFKPYTTVAVPPAPRSVTVGDFNGDGKADLAVADGTGVNNQLTASNPAGVTILLGNGNGAFTTAGQYNAFPTPDAGSDGNGGGDTVNPEFIKAVDLNHDGKLDLIESLYDHNIDIFLGNGNGTFKPAVGYTTGEYPRAVAVADVNHDGVQDLVVDDVGNQANSSGPEAGGIAVLLGNGDGTYQAPRLYAPFQYPGWLAMADFNGDGLPDIAVSRVYDGHSVNVMLDQTITAGAPTVTHITPTTGPTAGGTEVTIAGTNFTAATKVLFGTVSASSIEVNSSTSITAIAPAATAGTVDVRVVSTAGTSATSTADHFVFVAPVTLPAPSVVSPGSTSSSGPVLTTLTPTFIWHAVTGVSFTGYQLNLFNRTTGAFVSYQISKTATRFTLPTALAAGDSYVWNLRLINGSQSGPPSTYLYFQTPVSTKLVAPVVIGPGSTHSSSPALTTTTPTFTWHAVTGVAFDAYQLNLYDQTSGKFLSFQISPTATSFTPPSGDLASGDTFVWNLRLRAGSTTGPESAYLYFRTS